MIAAKRSFLTLQCEACASAQLLAAKPVLDVYKHPTGKLREGHVFEVDVTSGDVLKGRTRAYMLLYIMHDNEA
jgi:hypothetical protein